MFHILRFIRNYKRDRHYRVMQISVFFLVWAVAFAIFEYFVPLYLDSLKINFFLMGVILSGSSFISFFTDPFLGYIQKKFPPKTLLVSSILLFCFNMILMIKSGNAVFLLFIATNIYGIAFDLFSITSYKTVFDNSVEEDRSTNISFLESLNSVGLLIGAIIAGFIVSTNLNNAIYLCLGILLFLMIIILSMRTEKTEHKTIHFGAGYSELYNEIKKIGGSGLFLIGVLIFLHLYDGFFFVFEPIFALKFSGLVVNETIIGGFLLAVYTLPVIFFEPVFGKLEDRIGRERFVFIGLLISAAFIFLLQASDNLILSAVSIFGLSLGFYAIVMPAIEGLYESVVDKKFGKCYRGCSVSIMEICLSIGFFFGPLIGGFIINLEGGFNFAFRFFSILTVLVAFASVFVLKDKMPRRAEA